MPIFYLLHNLFNELNVNETGGTENSTEHGKRNCKLFMLGVFCYVVLFTFLMHLKVKYPEWIMNDAFKNALIWLLVADGLVMFYIYKAYFGRSLFNEVDELGDHKSKFDYDSETHTYTKKNKDLIKESIVIVNKNKNDKTDLYTGETCLVCSKKFNLDTDILMAFECGHIVHKACETEKCPSLCYTNI